MKKKRQQILLALFLLAATTIAAGTIYVRNNPLVFNESFWQHAHCIKAGAFGLLAYAEAHGGKFPTHPGGYGDALLLLEEDYFYALTGPGHDEAPMILAKRSGAHYRERMRPGLYSRLDQQA